VPSPSLSRPVCAHRSVSCTAGVRHRHPVEPLRLRRRFATPALLLEVNNLPVPLIWLSSIYSSRDCSPEQSNAAVSPLCHGLCPLVPLRQRVGHGRVRQTSLIAPRLVPEPLVPPPWSVCSSLVNSRRETERRHRAQVSPLPLDLGRPSEIEWFSLNPSRSNPSPSIGI
jgi:hypothetical protein